PPAPVSNRYTRSPSRTSSGCTLRCSWSVSSPAAASTPATSSGVRPTPNTLLSLGTDIPPSRSAAACSVPIWKAWTLSPAGSAAGVASGAATGVVAASAACSLRLQAASAAPSATTSSGSAALRTCDMADSLGGPPDSGGGAGVRQAMAACTVGTLECGAGLNRRVPATTPVPRWPRRQAVQGKAGGPLLVAALAPAPALAAREAAGDSDLQHVVEHVAACMGDRRMVLLGEAHGTREVPLLVAGLAERGSRKGPLLLALEIHGSEHRPLADY